MACALASAPAYPADLIVDPSEASNETGRFFFLALGTLNPVLKLVGALAGDALEGDVVIWPSTRVAVGDMCSIQPNGS